ncbi:MAG: DNA-3-methyladenine glycosylase 2 family protein [Firmicutes bacterium]|nr:DNA-3-methyladenine glycosylase 2 family protein [Bacillota bacterium]
MSSFILHPLPPFRLDLTAWVLRRLPANKMDRWDGRTYRRVLVVRGEPVELSTIQTKPPDAAELIVSLAGPGAAAVSEADIAPILMKMLGTNVDLADFCELASFDARLLALAQRFVGFRPPRLESIFEALVNGIACQQLSLIVGITLLNRLSGAYGLSVGEHHAFPRPEDLAGASEESLRSLGFSGRKARNILAISRSVDEGTVDLDGLEQLDDDSAQTALCGIPGVGRWTAQYVELRGMGRLNVFPADDVGGQKKLQRWLDLSERPKYEDVRQILDRWSPHRGLIYFLLLLDSQASEGLLQSEWNSG